MRLTEVILPSFPPSLLPSFPPSLPSFPPSLLPSFPPSLLPSFPPSLLPSFPPSLLPSFPPSLLPSFPPSLLPSFPPSLLPSFPSSILLFPCFPSFFLSFFHSSAQDLLLIYIFTDRDLFAEFENSGFRRDDDVANSRLGNDRKVTWYDTGDREYSATSPRAPRNAKTPRIGNRAENEKMNMQLYQEMLAKQRNQKNMRDNNNKSDEENNNNNNSNRNITNNDESNHTNTSNNNNNNNSSNNSTTKNKHPARSTLPPRTRISATSTLTTTHHPATASQMTSSSQTTMPDLELVLLVDNREIKQKANRNIFHKMCGKGINCEKRSLTLGDFLWVVRRRGGARGGGGGGGGDKNDNKGNSKDGSRTTEELVCDVVIERKRLSDLAKSLEDGRYGPFLPSLLFPFLRFFFFSSLLFLFFPISKYYIQICRAEIQIEKVWAEQSSLFD